MKLLLAFAVVVAVSATGIFAFPCNGDGANPNAPFCLNPDYEPMLLPEPPSGGPTQVNVTMKIQDVEQMSDREQTMRLQLHLEFAWTDDRIVIQDGAKGIWMRPDKTKSYPIDLRDAGIWLPPFEIDNLVAYKESALLRAHSNLVVFKNFTLVNSVSVHATVGCHFNFDRYPMDDQSCAFRMHPPADYGKDELVFVGHHTHYTKKQRALQGSVTVADLIDDDSVAGFEVRLERSYKSHMVTLYLPAVVAVLASWMSFLLTQNRMAARVLFLISLTFIIVNIK